MGSEETVIKQTKQVDFGRRSGLKCYPVSIGSMRLPDDYEQTARLVRLAIDANMIYIDTARAYNDSELKLAGALKDGYRQKVILSSKWTAWSIKYEDSDDTSADCLYKRLLESLERLQVEYLDFYQLWNIDSEEHYKQATEKGGMLDGIRRAVDEGLVKHIGMTVHDKPEKVSRYIDEADWCEAILFTYNILNQEYKDVIAKAHGKGIATLVMNPVGGGTLTGQSPAIKKAFGYDSISELAHRYIAGDENVDTILCGIASPGDITSTLANYEKQPLTPEERKVVEQAAKKLSPEQTGFCTACGYCTPCPQKIPIPQIMNAVYLDKILQCPDIAKLHFDWWANPEHGFPELSECSECGQCEEKCTQKIKIIEQIRYAKNIMGTDK